MDWHFWVRGRMGGKRLIQSAIRDFALLDGDHVHSYLAEGGVRCDGGDPQCPVFEKELRKLIDDE